MEERDDGTFARCVFDLLIGDPHCFYHPIRLVGNLISVTEKGLRAVFPKTEQGEKQPVYFCQ